MTITLPELRAQTEQRKRDAERRKSDADRKLKRLVAVAEEAGRRTLTDDEEARFDELTREKRQAADDLLRAEGALEEVARVEEDEAEHARLDAQRFPSGAKPYAGGSNEVPAREAFKEFSRRAAEQIVNVRSGGGPQARGLNSGSIDTYLPISGIALPELPTRVFDVIRVVPVDQLGVDGGPGSLVQPVNGVTYLRQVARTNNAEFVPDAGEKPESVFTLEEVEDRLRTLAHLSEPIPNRYLDDVPAMRRFVEDEMVGGLLHRLNGAIVNGDDTEVTTDEFDGLLIHAGTPAAFTGDVVTTSATLLTGQIDVGETPNFWVFNSTDWQGLSLTREEQDGTYLFGTPADGPGRRLHGLPVLLEPALAAGTGLLIDSDKAELRATSDISIRWNGDAEALFKTNQVIVRVEWRVVLCNFRPSAFKAFKTVSGG